MLFVKWIKFKNHSKSVHSFKDLLNRRVLSKRFIKRSGSYESLAVAPYVLDSLKNQTTKNPTTLIVWYIVNLFLNRTLIAQCFRFSKNIQFIRVHTHKSDYISCGYVFDNFVFFFFLHELESDCAMFLMNKKKNSWDFFFHYIDVEFFSNLGYYLGKIVGLCKMWCQVACSLRIQLNKINMF